MRAITKNKTSAHLAVAAERVLEHAGHHAVAIGHVRVAFGMHGAIVQCGDAHLEVVQRQVDVLALGENLGACACRDEREREREVGIYKQR